MVETALALSSQSAAARVRRLISQPAVQRSLPLMGVLGFAGAAALVWSVVSTAPQRDVASGLAESEKAAVAAALEAGAIGYTIDSATGAIRVSGSDYHKARMLLAARGLPKGAPSGAALLDAMPMGASHAVELERLRNARESDLARTIEAIDAVEQARVHIADGASSPFIRDAVAPSASVMLTLRSGRVLDGDQVLAIGNLVAASVSGLAADRVAITDQAGRLLNRDERNPALAQLSVQQRVEAHYRNALATLLTPIVGPDGFTVEVNATLDLTENESTRESYPQDQRAVRAEQSRWTSALGEPAAIGIPGTLSNAPPPAATVSAMPPRPTAAAVPPATSPARTSEDVSRSYELGREVAVSKTPAGTVKRLTVAVALRERSGAKPRSAAEIAAIDGLVKRTVGFDVSRGDDVMVSSRAFAGPEPLPTSWLDMVDPAMVARYVAALMAVAIFVFGIGRPFLRHRQRVEAERKAQLVPMLEGEIARQRSGTAVTLDMISTAPSYVDRAALVRDFVSQDPKRAAAVVRSLLKPEAGNG